MAERRKIVKSGNTSYILALPINWVRSNNLEKNRFVQVSEDSQGDLIISGEKSKITPKENFVTIKVDGKEDEDIKLEFLKAYIRDANSIIFEGKEILQKTSKLLENTKFFIGVDVIEQSTTNIVVKNFFSLDNETSPFTLLRKMDIVNRACFELLHLFFNKNFANEDFFELQKLNEQNERLFILTKKSILKLVEYPYLMKNIQTNYLQIFKEKAFAQSLRNISLSLLLQGKAFLFLDNKRSEIKEFNEVFLALYEDYKNIINAVNNKSYEEVCSFLKKHHKKTEKIDKFLKRLEDPLMIQAVNPIYITYNNLQIIAEESLA